VSEVVGYVLLLGVTTLGISVILVVGGSALGDLQIATGDEGATTSLGETEERLSALAGTRTNSTTVQLRGKSPGQVAVVEPAEAGHVDLSVNAGACRARLPLSTVRFDREGGGTVGYQAGGVFEASDDGSSAVVSPPSLTTSNGTFSLTTYNLSGQIDDREVEVRKDATLSTTRSRAAEVNLSTAVDSCNRPDNVTISVTSEFYVAWADHIEAETGVTPTTYDANRTVVAHYDQSYLPRSTNDSANRVVDLSDPGDATVVSNATVDRIEVDKGANNSYVAYALPLGNGTQASYLRNVDGGAVYRAPVDTVFVIDESGSMCGPDYNPSVCDDDNWPFTGAKIDDAENATKNYVGQTNESTDRVGFVGYDTGGRYHLIDGDRYFTNDTSEANETVDDFHEDTRGGTNIAEGMRRMNVAFDLKGEPDKRRIAILLSDGLNQNGPNEEVLQQARRADRNGITVYTVGFGASESNVNETLLTDTARATGGRYKFASDADELDAIFQEIFANVTDVQAVVHEPTAAQLSVGGSTVSPQVSDGAPDSVTRINNSTYDVNDPRYRSAFEFSASPEDGNLVNVSTVSYECNPGGYQLTDVFVTNSTTNRSYRRVRCVDVNESSRQPVPPSNVSIFLDGANVTSLPPSDAEWWQEDLLDDTLDPYVSTGRLDLKSNQAVVILQYPREGGGRNRLVLLFEIGVADEDSVVEVFDVRTVTARVGDG
jgi:Mg-chelatase subunit ChlD